ncbi:MAG: APC family permease, partial [Ferroplasma sp.]
TMEYPLKKNSISLHGLIFQGMGQLSPLFTFNGIISVAAFALGASPLAFLIGLIASLLTGNTLYQFSKRTASARGYYGYSGYGFNKHAAFLTSYLYLIYQLANLIFILSFFIMIFSPALFYLTGVCIPFYYGIVLIAFISLPAFYSIYRGIEPSFKTQITVNIIEIAFVVVISIIIIATSKDNTLAVFTPISGYKDLFLGFITGSFLAYTGYGSIVPLGEEAKSPQKNIGIAIIAMLLIIGVLDLLISYALVVGFGLKNMNNFTSTVIPAFIVIKTHIDIYAAIIFFVFDFFIIYTLFNTIGTAITRNIYAMARDGFMPEKFSKINKYGTPVNALKFSLLLFIIVSAIATAFFYIIYNSGGFLDEFIFFATVSTFSTLIIHLIVNSALSHIHKSWLYDLIFPTISTIIILVAMYYAVTDLALPFTYAGLIFAVYIAIIIILDRIFSSRFKKIDFASI